MELKILVENPLEVHYVVVEITDVNDNTPTFPKTNETVEISEQTLTGNRFQLHPAVDPDAGINSVRTYTLSANEYFDINVRESDLRKTPFLILKKALDREETQRLSLLVTAVDGGKPRRSGTLNVTVIVLDSNDNRPVFTQEVYEISVKENVEIGAVVIGLTATDADDGTNGEIEYSLRESLIQEVQKVFMLNKITGEITTVGLLNSEETDQYELDVEAIDKGTPLLRGECRVIIKILDVNDNSPEIDVTSLSNTVSEDSKPGTVIALISVTDKDSGVNGKINAHITNNVPFELKPSYKENTYSVVTKDFLDREEVSNYDITIKATDCGEPPLSTTKTLSIQILDVNDNSPQFEQNPLYFYIVENNVAGTSLFSVTAADKDKSENADVSYSIARTGQEKDVSLFLNVNAENGQITALKSFDFEALKSFQFQVVASDSGTPSLSSNVTVHVFILDQNDNAPVILYPVSSNGSAEGVEELPRNVNAGHLVTKVRAYDADIGYNGWLLFSLQEVTDHSLFGLDRYTGQIRTLRSFTETDEAEHKLVILVKDNGNVSLSATATVLVKVVEPREAFAASDVKSSAKDAEDTNVTFYLMITLASVSALFIISIIVLIAMQCSKSSTDYTSKYLQDTNYDGTLCHSIQYRSGDKRYMLVGPRMSVGSTIVPGSQANTLVLPDRRRPSEEDFLDREEVSNYDITIKATDCGEPPLSTTKTLSIQILDVNDNSPQFEQNPLYFYIVENNVAGTSLFCVTAADKDKSENADVSYSIARTGQEKDVALFLNVNAENGQITALKSFDFEALKSFQFQVVASDSGTPSLSSNVTVHVFILDQNDNAPVILYPVSSNGSAEGVDELPRNVNAGHLVTKVRAYDADIGYNGWLLFSLQEVTDHSMFGLDRYTGQIRTLRSFTETDEAEHKLVILVKDNGNVSLSATATVLVKVVEPREAFAASDVKSSAKDAEDTNVTFYLMITLASVSALFIISIIVLIAMQCSKSSTDYTSKYLQDTNYDGTLCHSIQYRSGDKRYMLVGPRMSVGSTIVPGSQANTLVLPDRRRPSEELRYSVTEEVKEGTIVGNVAKDLGLDKSALKDRKYRIVSGAAETLFHVDQKDGNLYVSHVNDNSPEFVLKPYSFYITEGNEAGAQLFSVQAVDPDEGENAHVSYHIYRDGNEENKVTSFLNINSENGQITALKSFDFETLKSFQFQVVASDSGTPSLSSNVTVHVFILDQNDNAPVILYPEVTDHSLFGLDRYTGQVRTLRSFTETDEAEHKLVILVKDNGNVSLSATATVLVKVVEPREAFAAADVKSSAKDAEDTNVTFYLMITLASVSALFIISIIVLIAMQCSKSSTDYTSKYLQDTNYDGTLCHSIQYRSGDKRYMLVGPRMSVGSTIVPGSQANTLVLPDRRRPSEEIRYSVPEEVKDGTVVGNVAKDLGLDVASLGERRFRVVSETNEAGFGVNSDNGALYVHGRIDREQLCQGSGTCLMELKVLVENPLEVHYVVVEITDNDNAPVILYPVSSNGSAEGVEELPRNVNAGHLVTKVRAYDADIGYNGWLLFSLQEVTDHSLFGLDRYTGQIRTLRSFTETDEAEHKLVILVKDNGNVSLSATATVLVKVVEPREAFAASDVKSSAKDAEDTNVTFYLMITLASVSALFIISIIVLIAMQCSKSSTDYTSKYLQDTNYDGTLCHSIQYRSGDKRYMLVGPRMSVGSTIVPGSQANTLVLPDRRRPSEEFQVVASDSGTPSLSSNVTVHVFILDQNDNAPVILYPVSSNGSAEGVEELPRNVNAGHLVTKEVTDHSLFGLDRYTGQIRTLRSFTETDEAEHKLVILVKDNGNVSLSATATVLVKVVEPERLLQLLIIIVLIAMQCSKSSTDYTSKYLQDTNYDGTLCHSIQYRSGDKRYMLVGPRMSVGSTIVPGSQANTLVLPDRRRPSEEDFLDREEVSNYDITIKATDCGEPPLSTTKTLSIQILDVNDNSPQFEQNPLYFYIVENNVAGTSLFSVTAADKDKSENADLSYSIARTGQEKDVALFLNVNAENGQITALKSFDFEILKSFQFQVVASDSGTPSLSSNVTVHVFILDQNDNAPVILYPVSSNGSAEGVEELPAM
ncbi:hypothetical protein WMY93_009651 [Mugilogobius chulae]|uniref:Cadherin domain-containing protein n=1 Tax=Mugilogobius chulae TaxID=88201 RepID=A0AAW0PIK0_9GOBI